MLGFVSVFGVGMADALPAAPVRRAIDMTVITRVTREFTI